MKLFEIREYGGRHNAVFPTFVIPARSRDEAERLGNLAVARGRMQRDAVSSNHKDIMLAFAKGKS